MAYPFNHKEFVTMMEQYNLKSNSITIPEHTVLNDLVLENKDCVYLLKSGILAGYIDFDNDKIYSIFTSNFFMGYYTIFQNRPLVLTYQYRDKKDQLAFVFEMLIKILDIQPEDGVAIIPKAVSTTVIKNYCTLSKAFFYSQLKELKEAGIISKVKLQWHVNMEALLERNNDAIR
ncbi:Crp/Fnr family transcriptional regulator [Listeria seeligeri]|uniref:Crp/Fnr family transcriptional regulator n=1 Tax=Listeria seeligeri TaxID=1640 RepID=UPI0018871204|nr:Crp/Fnr family transcriptional regulator [Listeria seeligeri]MBF2631764.1 Crp/Fnr family transcriptional regulator [Listeria seeligeri]